MCTLLLTHVIIGVEDATDVLGQVTITHRLDVLSAVD